MRALLVPIVWTLAVAAGFLPQSVPQAPSVDAGAVDAALESANELWKAHKTDEALPAFERILQDAQRLGLERQQADARVALAEILTRRGEYAAAREQAQHAHQGYV